MKTLEGLILRLSPRDQNAIIWLFTILGGAGTCVGTALLIDACGLPGNLSEIAGSVLLTYKVAVRIVRWGHRVTGDPDLDLFGCWQVNVLLPAVGLALGVHACFVLIRAAVGGGRVGFAAAFLAVAAWPAVIAAWRVSRSVADRLAPLSGES